MARRDADAPGEPRVESAADPGRLPSARALARQMRRTIIERSLAANVGHIGSALSIVELLAAVWTAMRTPGTEDPGRDRLILAKGHAALALYAALRHTGRIDEAVLNGFCTDGSLLGVHPEHELSGVDLSTGSLGQGLSVGCGLAWGLRAGLRPAPEPARVFVLMSDAECNEGQVWEAAMFAGHHRLGNLTAIVDVNGIQALGPTREILAASSPAAAWRAFGWDAVEVDGHNLGALLAVLAPGIDAPGGPGGLGRPGADAASPPRVVLARTIMGRGVSFMEGQVEWHYRNLSPELARQALAELEALS